MTQILVVDDEILITDSLRYSLQREGYSVSVANDGRTALQLVEKVKPDLIVLDLMLPDIDGIDLCRQMRANSKVPIIMLTARGEETDRVVGLETGADDYLTKPFSFRELLARVRALLRRIELDRADTNELPVQIGDIRLEPSARRARKRGQEIELSAREYDLLQVLITEAGRARSRDALLDAVWGSDWLGDLRTLDVHIRWLRLKLEDDPAAPRYIQTVRGYGYRFAGPDEFEEASS